MNRRESQVITHALVNKKCKAEVQNCLLRTHQGRKFVRDMKVLPSEECIIQYKQLLKIENKRHQVKVCTLEKDTENI